MRIYPSADVYFYVDKPGSWGNYIKHGANYSWKQPIRYFRPKHMNYWTDSIGSKKAEIGTKDLYFKNWPKSRIRNQACLGMLYGTGFRFIKLSKAPPAGFKCAPLPVNLEMAHRVNNLLKEKAKAKRLAEKKAQRERKAKKAAELAFKNRGKPQGRN